MFANAEDVEGDLIGKLISSSRWFTGLSVTPVETLAWVRGRTKRDTGVPNGLLNELNF